MRIFLKDAKQVGDVSYPSAGFYNVGDELGGEWLLAGLAMRATDANEIIEEPMPQEPTVAPLALEVPAPAADDVTAESATKRRRTKSDGGDV